MTETTALKREDYRGQKSTLCPGCGHNSISNQIISVAYELGLPMWKVAKLSGIGCSSKTPAYFLRGSHGFNSVHGRMPSVATGATLANADLIAIGVSGDGDTGSIGFGQYKHAVRRNVPMVYIIENNGVYGLTKGQFSATADEGQFLKYYGKNDLPPIDLCLEAVVAGATFVARSFSGDAKQVRSLLKAAIAHKGMAVLDIVSPCVTFNNAPESTKSFPFGQEHEIQLQDIEILAPGYVPDREEITVGDYAEGEIIEVEMHDGSIYPAEEAGKGSRSAQPDGSHPRAARSGAGAPADDRPDLLRRAARYAARIAQPDADPPGAASRATRCVPRSRRSTTS